MFGRRKREQAAAEAAREEERRTLFLRLAERPDTVCPFLGMAAQRTAYRKGADDDHRCYAFGEPATLSDEQQTKVCLERGYGNCPRYLRGVLVIPTEELEALRRPREMPAAAAAQAPPPPRDRRRAPLIALLALLLLVAGGGAAAWFAFGEPSGIGAPIETPSHTPDVTPDVTAEPTAAVTPTADATPDVTAGPTADLTPSPDPTPLPEDEFDFYEVGVRQGDYVLFDVSPNGDVVATRGATFSRFSQAPVELVDAPNGLRHWRTTEGFFTGLSYIFPDSGDFEIRAVYRRPDGSRSSELVPEDDL